jgi:hypothetical protein
MQWFQGLAWLLLASLGLMREGCDVSDLMICMWGWNHKFEVLGLVIGVGDENSGLEIN